MTPKHTPGPWRLDESHDGTILTDDDAGVRVAEVVVDNGPSDEQIMADARLIAAAPTMFDALNDIARGLTNGQKERGETPASIARAILETIHVNA